MPACRQVSGRRQLAVGVLALLLLVIEWSLSWYLPALTLLFWTAAGAFGVVTPTVNCLVFALFERVRLGRGEIRSDSYGHFYLDLGSSGHVEWLPSTEGLGWRRRASVGEGVEL